jgi:hypothetical protein
MVFTEDEINTASLNIIKEESKSSIRKEIEYLVDDFFNNNECEEFDATSKDIKERFFDKNNQISINYIFKVLKTEMKINQQKMKRYYPFNEITLNSKTGQPFTFTKQKSEYIDNQILNNFDDAEPF